MPQMSILGCGQEGVRAPVARTRWLRPRGGADKKTCCVPATLQYHFFALTYVLKNSMPTVLF